MNRVKVEQLVNIEYVQKRKANHMHLKYIIVLITKNGKMITINDITKQDCSYNYSNFALLEIPLNI